MAYRHLEKNLADNLGEQYTYERFKELLPGGFVCYHNRQVGMLEFDFEILAPGCGILVCEVEGHKSSDIEKVQDNGYLLQDSKLVFSPYEQTKKYRFLFASLVKNQTGKKYPSLRLPVIRL